MRRKGAPTRKLADAVIADGQGEPLAGATLVQRPYLAETPAAPAAPVWAVPPPAAPLDPPRGLGPDGLIDERYREFEAGLDWAHPLQAPLEIVDRQRGIVRPPAGQPRRSRVAIVGYANTSRHLAPFDDPRYEIWGLNQLYRFIPRADRWFEIHTEYNEAVVEGTDYEAWVRTCPVPLYMTHGFEHIPNAVRFPIEEAMARFGDYFTSTIAYMFALAIMEGFEEIAVYGIDLVVHGEYLFEKPCAEYYLGYAMARGVTVRIPEASALLKQTHRYGYQKAPDPGLVNRAGLESRLAYLRQEADKTTAALFRHYGGLDEVERILKEGPEPSLDKWHERRDSFRRGVLDLKKDLINVAAREQEVTRLLEYITLRERGSEVDIAKG